MKKNGSSSTHFLITDGAMESQERNAKDSLPHVGLNVPVFIGESNSSGEIMFGLSPTKSLENGNYIQRSFSLDTEQSTSSRNIPRSSRISCSSTATSPNTLFAGFQIPTETIIPGENVTGVGKKKRSITAQEAIPVLPRSAAIICLILNILIPGLGRVVCVHPFFLYRCQTQFDNSHLN